jgi:riboflavin transporter FmnP
MDFKDVIITICGMFFGPASAILLAVVVPFIEFLTISGTGVYGLIMNFLSSFTFAFTAGLIYKYKKTLLGAIIGLVSSVFAVTAVMMLANLIVTPYYTHMPTAAVAQMIPTLLLPFNFTKAMLNAALTLMLYKPITSVMRKTGFFGKKRETVAQTEEARRQGRVRSAWLFAISFVIAATALCVILLVWNGKISFFDIFKS